MLVGGEEALLVVLAGGEREPEIAAALPGEEGRVRVRPIGLHSPPALN